VYWNDFLEPPDTARLDEVLARLFRLKSVSTGLRGGQVILTEVGSNLMEYPAYLECEEAIGFRYLIPRDANKRRRQGHCHLVGWLL
jgi:hypothetical protein